MTRTMWLFKWSKCMASQSDESSAWSTWFPLPPAGVSLPSVCLLSQLFAPMFAVSIKIVWQIEHTTPVRVSSGGVPQWNYGIGFQCRHGIRIYQDVFSQNLTHEFHETCHSFTFYFLKKDFRRCCDTTTPESIHTKDESKRGFAFAFIFGVNWPVQWM